MGKFVQDLKHRALHLVESISCRSNDVVENINPDGKGGNPKKKSCKVVVESIETEETPNEVIVESVAVGSVEIDEKPNKVVAESVAVESVEIKEISEKVVTESVATESVVIKEKLNEVVVQSVVVESVEFKGKANEEVVVVESVAIQSAEKVEIQERAMFQVNVAKGQTRQGAQRGGNLGTGGTKRK